MSKSDLVRFQVLTRKTDHQTGHQNTCGKVDGGFGMIRMIGLSGLLQGIIDNAARNGSWD